MSSISVKAASYSWLVLASPTPRQFCGGPTGQGRGNGHSGGGPTRRCLQLASTLDIMSVDLSGIGSASKGSPRYRPPRISVPMISENSQVMRGHMMRLVDSVRAERRSKKAQRSKRFQICCEVRARWS